MNQLGFLHWTVHDSKQVEGATQITASYDLPPLFCLQCGHPAPNLHRHEVKPQLYMDTPMHGKRCGILWLRKRFKCLHCGKTFFEETPNLDSNHFMTRRLVDYIQLQSLRRPFTHLAHEIGVDEKTIRLIFNVYVTDLDKRAIVEAPQWLGIDELTLARRPRCIFTDVKQRRLVGLISNRKRPAVNTFLSKLDKRDRVELVTIDMWPSYRDAARDFFPKAEAKDLLILEAWLLAFPLLKQVYELKETFYTIWDAADRATAVEMYEAWYRSLPVDLMPAFKELVSAMTNWQREIFAYFDHQVTNAYTEALNGLIKVSNRVGRGYSFEVIRAKMLYDGGLVGERRYYSYRHQIFSYMMPVAPESFLEYTPEEITLRLVGRDIPTLTDEVEQGTLWDDPTHYSE